MTKLTQADFITDIAKHAGITKTQARGVLIGIAALAHGGHQFVMPGLGTIRTVITKERNARNPATGASIAVPAKRKVAFRPLPSTVREV